MQWTQAIAGLIDSIRASSEAAKREAIRDEGMEIIGWVAGNVHEHPISRQLRDDIGRSGPYYRMFNPVQPNALYRQESEAVVLRRAQLYDSWFERGERASFNEDGLFLRMLRLRRIADELGGFSLCAKTDQGRTEGERLAQCSTQSDAAARSPAVSMSSPFRGRSS